MFVQDVEMESVSPNAVPLILNDFFAFALQAALLDTKILVTKAIVLSLRMISEFSAWNATRHDECIANGGFPFSKLCVVENPEPENKDASETEDDEEVNNNGGIEEEDGEDDDNVSGDESDDDDDPEDGPDANGDGGSEDEDEDEEDDEKEYEDDEDEDEEDDDEEEDEVPQPPAKKRK